MISTEAPPVTTKKVSLQGKVLLLANHYRQLQERFSFFSFKTQCILLQFIRKGMIFLLMIVFFVMISMDTPPVNQEKDQFSRQIASIKKILYTATRKHTLLGNIAPIQDIISLITKINIPNQVYPILDTRISVRPPSVRHAQTTPPYSYPYPYSEMEWTGELLKWQT